MLLYSLLQAVYHGVPKEADAWALRLEETVLRACADARRLAAGTFRAGETMLIMPGGGHCVLAGDEGKVVLAGEWHLRTDRGDASDRTPAPDGRVGASVRVYWSREKRWFSGVVDEVRSHGHPRRAEHHVTYDDGDARWHVLTGGDAAAVTWERLRLRPRGAPAGGGAP